MPDSKNLEELKAAGVIPQGAELSEAEIKVIEELSKREIDTLIDIREKLTQAQAEIQAAKTETEITAESITAPGSDPSDPFQSNIIL